MNIYNVEQLIRYLKEFDPQQEVRCEGSDQVGITFKVYFDDSGKGADEE